MRRPATMLAMAVAAATRAATAAPSATLAGRLTGAKLPARGAGAVPMRAVRLPDGRILGAAYARRGGRFSLRAQPGPYALLAAVVPLRGRVAPLTRVAAFTRARAGRRTTVRATLRKRATRLKRGARRSAARAAFVEVDYPAVGVLAFQAPDGDLAVMRRGVPAMLVTDLFQGIEAAGCHAVLVERMDLDLILREQRLQQDPRFDPTTRVRTGRLIANNQAITGTVTGSGGLVTITATHTDLRTGRTTTLSQTGPADDILGIVGALAPRLVQLICPHTPPAYDATFNGTWRSDLNDYTVRWNGSARLELVGTNGSPPDRWPPGRYAQYALRGGTVHAVLSGTRSGAYPGSCTVHGEADLVLPATPAGTLAVQLDQDTPAFSITIGGRGDEAIPYTETGDGCNQQGPSYPLTGVLFAHTPDPLTAPGPAAPLTANTAWDLGSGASRFSSQFTLNPAG